MGGNPKSATTAERVNNSHTHVPQIFKHPLMARDRFDSDEEFWFYHWLGEAIAHNIVTGWNYHKQTFQLSGRRTIEVPDPIKKDLTRIKKIFLLHPQQYTPDFTFGMKPGDFMQRIGYKNKLYPPSHRLQAIIIVDIKGKFVGKFNNSAITFPVIQKWLCSSQSILVNKLVPENFFRNTWVPKKVAFSSQGKCRRYKRWEDYPLYEDWNKK